MHRPLLLLTLLLLPACGSSRSGPTEPLDLVIEDGTTLRIPAGKYAAAFDAARHELRDAGFALERVDAYSGVITTWPSTSAGFATPWSRDQSSVEQELGDFFQRHARTVRITFETADANAGNPPASSDSAAAESPVAAGLPADLRTANAELLMRTRVVVERAYRPGWRIDNNSIRHSTYYTDPDLQLRGMQPVYSVARAEDDLLAERIAARIATAKVPAVVTADR